MNELQIFQNPEFGQIRTLGRYGDPWFVGKDVSQVLGYSNTKDALAKHVDQEGKGGSQIATPSGAQEMTIINESGLYSLIFASKLPSAKKFKRWVTSEVLPTIRRTGGYNAQSDSGQAIRLMEELLRAKDEILHMKQEIMELRVEAAQKEADGLRRQLEAVTVPDEVLERRREKDRERQRRHREKQKQAGQVSGGK